MAQHPSRQGQLFITCVRSETRGGFQNILKRIRRGGASQIVDCLDELRNPEYAEPMTTYLAKRFGENPKTTRVLIRAAGETSFRPLHDLLANRLLDPSASPYHEEIIDALGKTGRSDYAGLILPFLDDRYGFAIQSTAIYALELLGSPLAITPLLKIVENHSGPLRELAIEALRNLLASQMNPELLMINLELFPSQFVETLKKALGITWRSPSSRSQARRAPPRRTRSPKGFQPYGGEQAP